MGRREHRVGYMRWVLRRIEPCAPVVVRDAIVVEMEPIGQPSRTDPGDGLGRGIECVNGETVMLNEGKIERYILTDPKRIDDTRFSEHPGADRPSSVCGPVAHRGHPHFNGWTTHTVEQGHKTPPCATDKDSDQVHVFTASTAWPRGSPRRPATLSKTIPASCKGAVTN